eukprot:TRINITY_DN823_c0_g1_i2.p1 TRINITY_DN823_c0_g1~~TRINITY_DN823_c0_g1_i2.p1  ORF type:complete len:442 (-),score=155.51 TRINITY_DN823_c0_g1_i2:519-1799(-)
MHSAAGNPGQPESVPEIDPREIVFERKIGEGTYGTVFAGKCRGKEVAIKVFKRKDDALSDSELEKFREEVKIMSKLPHPNVVLFMGACTKRGKDLMIVTDLFPTDMETLLIKQRHETSIFQRICMARDAALGMNWLHCSDPIFIHRDLKLSNLLVNKQFRVSVCDFGLAQIKPKNVTNLDYDPHGSPIYMAPEVFVGEYNEKCDIYSFSICLWEMYTCRQAFTEMDDDLPAFIHAICDCDHRPVIPSGCSKRLAKLITLGWSKNPQLRPSFKAILDELNKLLIEIAIEDEAGRKMWRKYFFDKLEVTWTEFITALFKTLHILDSPHHPSAKVEALRNLLAEENKGVYGSDNCISIQNFGKILSYFGPLKLDNAARKTDESFLSRVRAKTDKNNNNNSNTDIQQHKEANGSQPRMLMGYAICLRSRS